MSHVSASNLSHLFDDPPSPHLSPLSLHDALPISSNVQRRSGSRTVTSPQAPTFSVPRPSSRKMRAGDRKSTRLNSSHVAISYAVFCLKKKTMLHVARDLINSTTRKSIPPSAVPYA